ncbi:MAG: hypothetical protein HYX94_00670 [Chloroflexi bacterium]|nr:hypothetical protein [Chloroflexota bacterium]
MVRVAVAALAGITLTLGVALFVGSLVFSTGVQVPSRVYASLGSLLGVAPGSLQDIDQEMERLPDGSPEEIRNSAFDLFNVTDEAKERLGHVPLKLGYPMASVAGLYDGSLNVVFIRQPYLQVVMHEYAHANYEQKPRWVKTAFAIALLRLWFENDGRYERARSVLLASFEMSGRYAKERLPFYPVHEIYAVITEVTNGDLNSLPPYLRPFYSDFLQSR